jgi:transcription elongation factor GreB
MSKAFTRESDQADDPEGEEIQAPAVPQGAKNYITPQGAARLRQELHQLRSVERPQVTQVVTWAAGNGDRSENADYQYGKRRLREIDRRIRFLIKRIESFEIVDPATIQATDVRFGATVTVRDQDELERTYTIVGIDESSLERGHISWISPLALALHRGKVGDIINFRAPKGLQELEIVTILYKSLVEQ